MWSTCQLPTSSLCQTVCSRCGNTPRIEWGILHIAHYSRFTVAHYSRFAVHPHFYWWLVLKKDVLDTVRDVLSISKSRSRPITRGLRYIWAQWRCIMTGANLIGGKGWRKMFSTSCWEVLSTKGQDRALEGRRFITATATTKVEVRLHHMWFCLKSTSFLTPDGFHIGCCQ